MYRRIRDLRHDHDLTQTQLAKMLGMSQTGYSKYETGENDIPTRILIQLAGFIMSASTICWIRRIGKHDISEKADDFAMKSSAFLMHFLIQFLFSRPVSYPNKLICAVSGRPSRTPCWRSSSMADLLILPRSAISSTVS